LHDELVRSLLEAVHTAATVLLLSWTASNVHSKPENCSTRSSTSRNTAYITCYPLHENCLSLIVSDLKTNCRTYLQSLLFAIPSTFYSVNDVFTQLDFITKCDSKKQNRNRTQLNLTKQNNNNNNYSNSLSLQFVVCILSDCVIQPSSCHITIND